MKTAKPKKVEMISYSIKMVIPTGAYANIQPEIVVKAGTPEEAHEFIAPHMNKLWKEYFMINERRPEPKVNQPDVPPQSPVSSVAFTKASQAIASCLGMDALELIRTQIHNSVKLTNEDKVKLVEIGNDKAIELTK
jgi:hypothetical protein